MTPTHPCEFVSTRLNTSHTLHPCAGSMPAPPFHQLLCEFREMCFFTEEDGNLTPPRLQHRHLHVTFSFIATWFTRLDDFSPPPLSSALLHRWCAASAQAFFHPPRAQDVKLSEARCFIWELRCCTLTDWGSKAGGAGWREAGVLVLTRKKKLSSMSLVDRHNMKVHMTGSGNVWSGAALSTSPLWIFKEMCRPDNV